MSTVASIIARLSSAVPPAFAIVEGATEWAAVSNGVPTALPAAYVMTLREASEASERMTGPILQRMEADIAVVLVTSNVSDVAGGAVSADIEELKKWTRARLIGFTPVGSDEPLQHVSGELLKAKNGVVWHEEVVGAATYLEEQQS